MNNTQVLINECAEQANIVTKAFCEGGAAMYVIAVVGILTVILILERLFVLQNLSIDKESVNKSVFGMLMKGQISQAISFCDSASAPLTNTIKAGLVQVMNKRPDEEVQVAMDASVLKETPRLEGWTPFLAVFGNIAVLIGLLGTIIGLITAFGGVSEADVATKAALLSKGISEALNCTAFGLGVAIVAITAYGFLQLQIDRAVNDMVESSMNLMNKVVSNRDKATSN